MTKVITKPTVAEAVQAIGTIVAVKNLKGTSFVGVRNYQNKEGEVSNQTFVVGIDYEKLLRNDLAKLTAFDLSTFETTIDKETVKLAHKELIESLVKRLADETSKAALLAIGDKTIIASEAQKAAYTHIAKGLKTQDNFLYIYGLMVRKTVVKPVEYKKVNSAAKTIAKKQIGKAAQLQGEKYKMFKLGNLEELKISGVTL